MLRALLVFLALVAVLALAVYLIGGIPSQNEIMVAGETVSAETEVLIEREVVEYREGTEGDDDRLAAGQTRYEVFIISPALIPQVEATLEASASSLLLSVTVEDGRSFGGCLVESSTTANVRPFLVLRKRQTRYGLRCTGPV